MNIKTIHRLLGAALSGSLLALMMLGSASAVTNPQAGSVGLSGTISTAAPTHGATITTPVDGASFTALPVTVTGLCPDGLLVKVFSNNVFVGSEQCNNGSYSIQIDLFGGQNDLVARVYDALDQAGPDSNTPTVNFNDATIIALGSRVALTSTYAKLGADPNTELDWPVILSGGIGPYAISVDWGDGSQAELISQAFPGVITIKHIYKNSGVYNVVVTATDSKGTEAFLQLVGVANGATQSVSTNKNTTAAPTIQTKVLWWPAVTMVPLIGATFWIGGRHQLFTLRRQLERNRDPNKL